MTSVPTDRNDRYFALAQKYAVPGPRYTSYPPANRFVEYSQPDALVQETLHGSSDLSLYFHIPFCETLCWYCGCHQMITRDKSKADNYLELLEKEMKLYAKHIDSNRQVKQVHLGGGTPNFLSADQIARLNALVRHFFVLHPEAEIGVELDPRRLDESQIEAFAQAGFNRASFGVQDCNPEVQEAIHRIQPEEWNQWTMERLRAYGFGSVNVDLIYGLPYQTFERFGRT